VLSRTIRDDAAGTNLVMVTLIFTTGTAHFLLKIFSRILVR